MNLRWQRAMFGLLVLCVVQQVHAQDVLRIAVQPAPQHTTGQPFTFVSDGPAGPGWTRPDEVARAYFAEMLPAFFTRTLVLSTPLTGIAQMEWIFTGPHGGFTVTIGAARIRVSQRYYDSYGLSTGQGNYPERVVRQDERLYQGPATTLTVVVDSHLALHVLLNGQQVLEQPLLLDVTRHQLRCTTPRAEHHVISGWLQQPQAISARVTVQQERMHQTMLGFGGSPSIPAYNLLSEAGRQRYWQLLHQYNLLLSREYPMGTELKPDLSNLDDASQATPHYYGDNFPNGEVSSFDYNQRVLAMGGDVIYEMWALPEWATEPYNGPRLLDIWNKVVRQQARPEVYARAVVQYCRLEQQRTGKLPILVGVENEVEQPPEIFDAMVLELRRQLDAAGMQQVKIHMADAGYLAAGTARAKRLQHDPRVWKAIDYTASHEYDLQEFFAAPDLFDDRMRAMRAASGDKEFLATELCLNDPRLQEASYRVAFNMGQLYFKNLTQLDAVGLMYCWLLLDVEQPSFGASRALMVPDRSQDSMVVPSSFQLRVLGAFSRHVVRGMQRVDANVDQDADLLATAFTGQGETTVILLNRGVQARQVQLQGAHAAWQEVERTNFYQANQTSNAATQDSVLVQPGEMVVLSTVKAPRP
ncbi:MAG: hypothetical protein KGK08_09850 [Acidobacteriota bacterium]|nr:hypothetical protein [Acidobacteriota bacterium]